MTEEWERYLLNEAAIVFKYLIKIGVNNIRIVELINFFTAKKNKNRVYTDVHTIDIFNNTIKNAIKVDVNASVSIYKFEVAGKNYFLWLCHEKRKRIVCEILFF